ncbi:unconventional myosin-IXb isoform X1 [Odontomachus brunneus]|uniref:unconventional myosin-IXb isoform X1 n=1 Tax=Odontomachus brunneus TaxID=486640 RepID=UPI0013F1C19F|nr:unconventional myosin-IXb isoform X1 [Odontomachus brunneus]XP_032669500.1 unconventional myosin-IXb isoform X1 [Odontomachus brunneus]
MCLGRVGSRRGSDTSGGRSNKKDCIIIIRGPSNRGGAPAKMGMLLPDETYEARSTNVLIADVDEIEAAKALAALRRCDEFLKRHGIRPEFFCRHRERLALQAWLLKKSNLYSDASSSNEAVHLQQRLRSLSTELVTLRNRLHVSQPANASGPASGTSGPLSKSPEKSGAPSSPAPAVPPRTTLPPSGGVSHGIGHPAGHTLTASAIVHPHVNHAGANTLGHNSTATNNLISDLDPSKRHNGVPDDGIVSCVTALGCLRSPPISSIIADVKNAKSNQGQHRCLPKATAPSSGPATSTALDDLIHLPGPLTEDAVLKCLQARFCAKQYHTNVGPILVCVNPYTDVGNPLTLTSTRTVPLTPQLNKVVQEAVRQQSETGYPQAIILSGTSGSGKTYASMLLLRQLFDVAGGGPETDAFKHLAAAFTVLRSLGSAKTATNSESSRIGHFIEVQVTDGALYRTKIHCYFLDQTRVIRPLSDEKNYHIFYQMLAGLSHDERVKLNLEGYNLKNLRYLQHGDTRQDETEDAIRFQAWKACLGVLGIPFLDVVRVLAAVLILGNVGFTDGPGVEVGVIGENELSSVAALLGVPPPALLRGLTSRTHNARGQLVKSVCDANMSNMTRDSLAKALYCRTVATIVRRANSLKRLGSTLGTLSSDSNESVHNQAEVTSQHASTIGSSAGGTGSRSMTALNNAVRHATDGFIGILDMFGFEDPKPSQLEHLCINLCAETMQHFYNTHIFKSSIESCRDEGIPCDVEVDYVDNVPCIDLISSLRTGLLSMLDVEGSIHGTAESYVAKVKVQHKQNPRLFEPRTVDCRSFGIQHFAGRVTYDASDFLDTNKDVVPDDLVAVFYKHACSFGFATHLFGSELKALYASDTVPRGVSFRISPTSHTDLTNGDVPISTLTQDFHTRLDNLLRTLVHARPHFVRCIRSNGTETPMHLDRGVTMRQIRSLQVLETVNLMAGGYPHRMRFKAFNARYRLIAPFKQLRRAEEQAVEDTKLILQNAQQLKSKFGASTSWALGKRHIFLSEGIRQQLENLRAETRRKAAIIIQATWRGWRVRRGWPLRRTTLGVTSGIGQKKPQQPTTGNTGTVQRNVAAGTVTGTSTRPRPQPIAGTPPPDPSEKCADQKMIQQTCSLFGLDLERPPPVPPSRSYTVTGNTKLGYPQTRIMKMPFPEEGEGEVVLLKGETVLVVGASPRRGHLLVEHNNSTLHVPYQFMELKPCNINV